MVIPETVWIVKLDFDFYGDLSDISLKSYFKLANDGDMVVVIPDNEYSKVILEHHSNKGPQELIYAGAKTYHKSNLYKNIIDVKIQMAYIAIKYGIKVDTIEYITNNMLTKTQYKLLYNEIYNEFPEKLI